jgi:DNA-binding MarR family transcriptional regulator
VWLTVKTYSILYLISTGLDTSKSLLCWTYGSKPNMTKKIRFLEESWFISRTIDVNDKRIFRFSLTQKAHLALETVSPIYDKAISQIFYTLSDTDIKISLKVLEKCISHLQN